MFYTLINSLEPIKLKIFKIYIKINLVNNFIQLSKSFARIFILFIQNWNKNFCLCGNYQELNNLLIKN